MVPATVTSSRPWRAASSSRPRRSSMISARRGVVDGSSRCQRPADLAQACRRRGSPRPAPAGRGRCPRSAGPGPRRCGAPVRPSSTASSTSSISSSRQRPEVEALGRARAPEGPHRLGHRPGRSGRSSGPWRCRRSPTWCSTAADGSSRWWASSTLISRGLSPPRPARWAAAEPSAAWELSAASRTTGSRVARAPNGMARVAEPASTWWTSKPAAAACSRAIAPSRVLPTPCSPAMSTPVGGVASQQPPDAFPLGDPSHERPPSHGGTLGARRRPGRGGRWGGNPAEGVESGGPCS